jgi:hypothetical protein
MTDKDDNIVPFKELTPPKEPETPKEHNDKKVQDALQSNETKETLPLEAVKHVNDVMPLTLQTSALTSNQLRDAQVKLINLVTNDNYVALIASSNPETIPELINAVSNSVATSDNLMIKMAQVAEKNASMNKVFEIMTRQQEQNKTGLSEEQKDEYYDESVNKIKRAIYEKLDKKRNQSKHPVEETTLEPETDETKDNSDVIDAEYEVKEPDSVGDTDG